jgi:beta-phosphoglucomutase
VAWDASSGVQAGEMAALGVARLNDQALLNEAGTDLVVTSLNDVTVNALSKARLDRAIIR